MASLMLDVPLCGQAHDNSCWNASAQMIWWYWQTKTGKQGPMWTVPEVYDRAGTTGILPVEFVRLAKNVGMRSVSFSFPLCNESILDLLVRHGPLWCAGYWWGTKAGHVVVATGVSEGIVHLNDPAPKRTGSKKTKSVGEFNSQLANNIAGCLMRKDPDRY